MITITDKSQCTGCGACFNICPKNAISMKYNSKGFLQPTIDDTKCINCSLCKRICPINTYKSNNITTPKVYALQNNDKKILYDCASGGAFALFANYILKNKGVIYGVSYDDTMKVHHERIDDFHNLNKLYSSKYVQSNTEITYSQTKQDLQKNKVVLYSGTPCQIAGLKNFLQKDYENLITVDLICHGVPSPLVFEKYKKEYMKNFPDNENLLNINFRSKIKGWNSKLISLITTTTTTTTIPAEKDIFMKAFLRNLSISDSCLNCKFKELPRVADLTIGDFWGVDKYDKTINDNKGLSVVLINSIKGNNLIDKVKRNCFLQEVPLDVVIKYNQMLIRSAKLNSKREEFFKRYKTESLEKLVNELTYVPLWKRIINFVKRISHNIFDNN